MQYRDLAPDEASMEGDEYQDIDKEWKPSVAWMSDGRQNPAYRYRRPLREGAFKPEPVVTIKEYKQDDNEGYVLLSQLAEGGWATSMRARFENDPIVEYANASGADWTSIAGGYCLSEDLRLYRVPEDVAARYVTEREALRAAQVPPATAPNKNMNVYSVTQKGPGVVWPEGMVFGPPIEEHKPEPEMPKIVGVDFGNEPDKTAAVILPPAINWHDTVLGIRKVLITALDQLRDMETMYINVKTEYGQECAKLKDNIIAAKCEVEKQKHLLWDKDVQFKHVINMADKQGEELAMIRKRCTELEMECQRYRRKLGHEVTREQAAQQMKKEGM
jgi:hypothetical protein